MSCHLSRHDDAVRHLDRVTTDDAMRHDDDGDPRDEPGRPRPEVGPPSPRASEGLAVPIEAAWTPEALRRLAAAVIEDAIVHAERPECRLFLTGDGERRRTWRRRWLEILTDDLDGAEAALAQLVALPHAERRHVLQDAREAARPARGAWDPAEAIPGVLETSRRAAMRGGD